MANYIESNKIKVFPTSYRVHSIDPESYLNTEANLTQLKRLSYTYNNYVEEVEEVVTIDSTQTTVTFLIIYLGGYKFKVVKDDVTSLDLEDLEDTIFAGIKLINDNVVYNSSNNGTFSTKRLDNIVTTGAQLDTSSGDFQGLKFVSSTSSENFDAEIQVLGKVNNQWVIPQSSRLKISANEVGNDVDEPITKTFKTQQIVFDSSPSSSINGISDTLADSSTTAASVKAVKTVSETVSDVSEQKLDANGFSTSYTDSSSESKLYNDGGNIKIQAGNSVAIESGDGTRGGQISLEDDGWIYASSDGGHNVTGMYFSTDSEPYIYFPVLDGELALEGGIANNWSSAASYNVGDYVYCQSNLYRCKTKHTSENTFDSTKFDLVKLSQTKLDKIISCTYSDLNELRIDGHLVPGQYYLVNDYTLILPSYHKKSWSERVWDHTTITNPTTTKYFEVDYSSDGVVFGLLLKALSTSTFSDNAMTVSNDAYISGWNVKYKFANETSIFDWATSGGKGVIYYMEDKRGNVAPYDMINLKMTFKERNSLSDSWTPTLNNMYTFNAKYQVQSVEHKNLVTWEVVDEDYFTFWGNKIKPSLSTGSSYELPSVVFTKETSDSIPLRKYWTDNTVGLNARHIVFKDTFSSDYTEVVKNNIIEDGCSLVQVNGSAQNNIVKGSYIQVSGTYNEIINSDCVIVNGMNNKIESGCDRIWIEGGYHNKIGTNCNRISIAEHSNYNEIGAGHSIVTMESNCNYNKLGVGINDMSAPTNISLGEYCYSNIIGDECSNIVINDSCTNNKIGGKCTDIGFGSESSYNEIGDWCNLVYFNGVQNVFGQHCSEISLGSYAVNNKFGSDCSQIKALDHFENNTLYNGCNNFQLSHYYQNNVFMNGVHHFGILDYDNNEEVTYSSYIKNYIVETGVSYVSPGTLSGNENEYLQNVYVCGGINGTSSSYSSYKSVRPTARGLSYQTIFKNPNSIVVDVS